MSRFIDEKITVTTAGDIKQPASFVWRSEEYLVAEIILAWPDWGFAQGATQKNWRSRRHRNYYRVRTDSGRVFELYLDRGTKPGREAWFLYQELSDDSITTAPAPDAPSESSPEAAQDDKS